ncbi:MAG: glycoside hydrolase family 15 protein [Oculatellaceae cyanobacterium Prado106]|nr:glycoside hydrolase family 15 protein [Oculatellaceae cyanobacterium Prado106]
MDYQPIENYGIIGNMRTTALVGQNGSIDWFCFPNHDSPSVFASLLDRHKGGYFQIAPQMADLKYKQFYYPSTNVLVTRFLSPVGVAEIIDFMPVGSAAQAQDCRWLVRQVRMIRCQMTFRLTCYPAFNYARDRHTTTLTHNGAYFQSPDLSLKLVTDIPLQQDDRGVWADFELEPEQSMTFVLRQAQMSSEDASSSSSGNISNNIPGNLTENGSGDEKTLTLASQLMDETVSYWRRWLSKCIYKGRWREVVERSALVLKLLTYEPTGAIVAAPTCGLPEDIGGERNWDYRYTWIRDAAFTVYGFLRIGFTQEAAQFMKWLSDRCYAPKPTGSLQLVYSIEGHSQLDEEVLDHLSGYRDSYPVRIGNSAYHQLQLDIYGELMDAVYLYNKYGSPISYDLWCRLRQILDWVCDNWQRDDEGIWEPRDGRKPIVYLKLMCWVALDRGLRLADKRSFPAERDYWVKVRDQIYESIMVQGWNEELESFVQYYGSDVLDASSLIMPLVFFLAPNDPRMLQTIDAINRPPEVGGLVANNLVYRYSPGQGDGLSGSEGTFNLCTFWLVEALTRAGRQDPQRLDKARLMFEEMLSYANPLGLYSEEIGVSGEELGNYPQAFTHLALISAAWNLDKALDEVG